jgi:hypothetical protein
MPLQFLTHLIVLLVLPAYFIGSLWRGKSRSKLEWWLRTLYTGGFVLYLFLVGNWAALSHYLRYLLIVVYLGAVATSYGRITPPLSTSRYRERQRCIGAVMTLTFFLVLLAFAVRGHFYSGEPVRLSFPLRDGRYLVWQGGSSLLLNYHTTHRHQKYALDLVALNAAGARALGIYPAELERYAIFGATVFTPCDGTVLGVTDGLPDHIPPAADRTQAAGNHVVIQCSSVEVTLAHLQNGSVMVRAGDVVVTGQPLGRVGNSGNTSEPHLHIHAAAAGAAGATEGEGVPILFDGDFLVRNDIVANR